MKKKIINKVALLLPLIIGLVGCKKTKPLDLLQEPEPFKIVKILNEREANDVRNGILAKLKEVNNIKTKNENYNYFMADGSSVKHTMESELHAYTNCSFVFESSSETKTTTASGTSYPTIRFEQTITEFWKDDLMYSKIKTNNDGVESFKFEATNAPFSSLDEFSNAVFSFVYGNIMDTLVLDTDGNYHLFTEDIVREILPIGGGTYFHSLQETFSDVKIGEDFKILKSFTKRLTYSGLFSDMGEKGKEQLQLTRKQLYGGRATYGEVKDMPNIDGLIASLPTSTFDRRSELQFRKFGASYDAEQIVIDAEHTIYGLDWMLDQLFKEDGSAFCSVYEDEFELKQGEALRLDLEYTAINGIEGLYDKSVTFLKNISFLDSLSESASELLQIVEQDQVYYLVYLPEDPIESPNRIYLNIFVDYLISPTLVSPTEPGGEVTINELFVTRSIGHS